MSSPLHQRLQEELGRREAAGTRRRLPPPPAPGLVDFSSNDYLGLSRHPQVRAAVQAAAHAPAGSTGSRLLTGNSAAAEALEIHLARFHRAEAALLFNSGYAANLGFFAAVPKRGDTILYDAASHASVKEGIRGSFATAWSFRHNDVADLRRKLARATGSVFVAVEALYSMDGDMAPLAELAEVCREQGLYLVVDEAHTNGLYGPQGEGLVVELGLEEAVFARILTFGKALGSQGAAVAGPAVLRDYLLSFSRPFIYTTALPPLTVAALTAAYAVLPDLGPERARLFALSDYLKARLNTVPSLHVPPESHVIHPIFFADSPGPAHVRAVATAAQAAGFDVRAIVSPTVPVGTERLRLIIHSYTTKAEIDALAAVLEHVVAPER
ncbi:aminotransferase class I/II-fold pyridoxal phosphate-dependent enzyme [Microvirga sp. STR05]|uniref:Aminotransferase class I/II-fold pyridoxal phosphate-dependent enzyme n=1 Tax=Hymenobacter duratus TaxID=2771356 RepID=A0ABR8JEI5_9BACT|nr:aminotransferase class I/II-fold pyridoxal phosphate-dependent enzyme [Hymenobacter duratus]MBD2715267.1 aminotransferase class I/II-fold pyridoxal phosphate-dependent enzyme [Hymenobacter duratus]MBR7950174.1 aminotransferase class I/II-fold pyridoxal phosphate-dependent enzyme [Microvirga sp. STR05]